MTMSMTRLADRWGVLPEHLLDDVEVPVLSGLQCQGDVAFLPDDGMTVRAGEFRQLPADGLVLVDGTHEHRLVADPGVCRVAAAVSDPEGLAVAVIDCDAPVYVSHAEHAAVGLAAGRWVVRRTREQANMIRLVHD